MAGGPGLRNLRGALVLSEVALAFVLLAGAGLLLRSFDRLLAGRARLPDRSRAHRAALLPRTKYPRGVATGRVLRAVIDRLSALPSVRSAAIVSDAPLGDSPPYLSVSIQGQPPAPSGRRAGRRTVLRPARATSPRWVFLWCRAESSTPPTAPAGRWSAWSTRRRHGTCSAANPIGSRLTFEDPTDSAAQWVTIVGVVRDIRHAGPSEPPYPQVYLPAAQAPRRWVLVVARTDARDPLVLGEVTRQALAGLDPTLALSEFGDWSSEWPAPLPARG